MLIDHETKHNQKTTIHNSLNLLLSIYIHICASSVDGTKHVNKIAPLVCRLKY